MLIDICHSHKSIRWWCETRVYQAGIQEWSTLAKRTSHS
jgi:hypothetical protein